MRDTLVKLFEEKKYSTDKNTTHSYLPIYDKLFSRFKDKEINMLEVGVADGGSIELWNDYFTKATIFGFDIVDNYNPTSNRVIKQIRNINNISNNEFEYFPLTIAIDDGSHLLKEQLEFIKNIYPQIVSGGLLIIEDIQDLEKELPSFKSLGYDFEVLDLRKTKGRYDDVLLIFKK